jgi:hypothetical protein
VAVLAATLLVGCSSRSVEAFCDTLEEHKQRYLGAMDSAATQMESGETLDVLGGLFKGAVAIAAIQPMWEDLAKVAPDEIQTDVEAIRDLTSEQNKRAESAASNPFGTIFGSLMTSAQLAGPLSRVDTYIVENCE